MDKTQYWAFKAVNETQAQVKWQQSKRVGIMAKLGSEKNPLILRLADESNVDNIANICNERGWHFILGVEPDEEEDLTDLERKLNPPIQREATKIGRNKPCSCGSGKKYKKCCGFNA